MTEACRCRICGARSGSCVLRGVRDWEYGTPGEWDYIRCDVCGVVQIQPFPAMAELAAAYPADYEAYGRSARSGAVFSALHALVERNALRRWRRIVRPGEAVLDVGCGEGRMLARLQSLGAEPEGLDFSPHAAARCRARGFAVFQGTLAEFTAHPGRRRFGGIVMSDYLEHAPDPAGDLRAARTLLAPGGWIALSVPNFRAIDRLLFGRYWGPAHAPRHLFQFTDRTLPRLLAAAGFRDVDVRSLPSPTGYALSCQNLLQAGRVRANGKPCFTGGRARYYTALLVAFAPLQAACMAFRRVGMISVTARRA